ncbi:Pancreatic triacylglycerol lipase [Armadillidium vulgare]|nr:Pancreatic triacylglycerol lipase [Armadillidium vulgare]
MDQWLKDMAAALLQYGDYNVLRVDWGKGSLTLPDQALANTKVVGEEIAYFVNTLKEEFNLNPSNCHCIGHSMGGYVCGFAGQGINKLGRITALDPAPKEFFEDTIKLGVTYPLTSLLNPTNNLEENIIDLVANEVACGHLRPITYYIQSILNPSCQWVSYECSSFERFQKGECASCGTDSSNCGLLGPRAIEYTDKSREKVVLFIKTAAESPFCDESPSGGVITFEVIGNTGYFTDKLEVKKADQGEITKSLFVNHVDVGQISSVKLTWKTKSSLLGLLNLNSDYILGVIAIKVSPLSHYPESSLCYYHTCWLTWQVYGLRQVRHNG